MITARQRMFAKLIVDGVSHRQALRLAGYSQRTANNAKVTIATSKGLRQAIKEEHQKVAPRTYARKSTQRLIDSLFPPKPVAPRQDAPERTINPSVMPEAVPAPKGAPESDLTAGFVLKTPQSFLDRQPSRITPSQYLFSSGLWCLKNPKKDLPAAEQEAWRQGYEVVSSHRAPAISKASLQHLRQLNGDPIIKDVAEETADPFPQGAPSYISRRRFGLSRLPDVYSRPSGGDGDSWNLNRVRAFIKRVP